MKSELETMAFNEDNQPKKRDTISEKIDKNTRAALNAVGLSPEAVAKLLKMAQRIDSFLTAELRSKAAAASTFKTNMDDD
jgi:hypothetical protein